MLAAAPVVEGYFSRYLLGAGVAGAGVTGAGFAGVGDGEACGRAGAAPVVTPWSVLARGVTSRMPGGAAGGEDCVFCAVDDVPGFIDVLFRP